MTDMTEQALAAMCSDEEIEKAYNEVQERAESDMAEGQRKLSSFLSALDEIKCISSEDASAKLHEHVLSCVSQYLVEKVLKGFFYKSQNSFHDIAAFKYHDHFFMMSYCSYALGGHDVSYNRVEFGQVAYSEIFDMDLFLSGKNAAKIQELTTMIDEAKKHLEICEHEKHSLQLYHRVMMQEESNGPSV